MTGRRARSGLRADARGATALEFALTFPVILVMVFGLFAVYSLIACKRAIDVGIEKGLRYAAVHAGSGTTPVTSAFTMAAGTIWTAVGANSTVTVTPATTKVGDTVQISVSYNWTTPVTLSGVLSSASFTAITLSATGSMRVMN